MLEDPISLLFSQTKRHIAPIVQLSATSWYKKFKHAMILNQGTMTFVQWENNVYGITNEHVLHAYYKSTEPSILGLALDKFGPIPGKLLFKATTDSSRCFFDPRFRIDIAVFKIDESHCCVQTKSQ
jgi:hypothetical protein